jgi:AhpD family alkylhydroperoxidase
MTKTLATLTLITTALLAGSEARAEPDAKATYQDIQNTLGLVPTFMKGFPEDGIAAAWDELKSVQLNPKTALSTKQKELIGLAVAAQIPCKYCVYFHTNVGKQLGGATDTEVKEAVAMAAITRHWSTYLNGMQIDLGEFKQELAGVVTFLKAGKSKPNEVEVVDAASAYKDMEKTLGRVPTFMRRFPEVGIASAWREFKRVQLNPATKLDGKTKELIGLAVAAQVPCTFCIAFHTEAAKLNGATDNEIREAVAMASITRHWSTVLNGTNPDEAQFRREIDQVIANAKKASKTTKR